MEAGLEHLGRGTTEGVDAFVVVIEPGARSDASLERIKLLGKTVNINHDFLAQAIYSSNVFGLNEFSNLSSPEFSNSGFINLSSSIFH